MEQKFKWTDNLVVEFAKTAMGGSYGDYDGLKKTEDKLTKFKELNTFPKRVEFLDFIIHNSGNNDGWVILPNEKYKAVRYNCHLGNYIRIDDAKRYCVRFYMIYRPELFRQNIVNRLNRRSSGCWGEYKTMCDILEKEGLKIPEEITASKCINNLITFKDEVL